MTYTWHFEVLWEYRWIILHGLGYTILFTIICVVLGLLVGLLTGMGRLARSRGLW